MVAEALQEAAHEDRVDHLLTAQLVGRVEDHLEGLAVQGVHLGVIGLDGRRQLQVLGGHQARDVRARAHRQIGHAQNEAEHRLGHRRLGVAPPGYRREMTGQVALTLKGLGHAQGGDDGAQIVGDGLLAREQHDAHVVDIALEVVDALVGVDDLLGDNEVAIAQGLARPLDGGGHLSGHGLQVRAQLLELLVEDLAEYVVHGTAPRYASRLRGAPGRIGAVRARRTRRADATAVGRPALGELGP